ncbi:AfsR/SARP family transcriptional regulator [Desulfospira joergensenii]|uniref:AfsR/SARP family transcriptional regulator n=1 Tax=Desulfospira joergensenii TaxID=53329 RepID=UPI00129471B3|nr:BTAD domain-containing putative transcriptional regulator [Desulfospira joergensenii]
MKTAIFDELDTKILSLFFDTVSPEAILDELEQRNLFIRRIRNDTGRPVYRYNTLFRNFLAADLMETMGREGVLKLNRKAGEIYLNRKDSEKAVFHFRQAGCHNEIARIIRITGTDYVITGRTDRLAEWIASLPGEMTARDSWLILYDTMSRRIRGGKANITAFAEALEGFRVQADIRGQLLSIAYLIEASVFIRQSSRVILKWIRAGEQALEDLKGKHRFSWARTLLWQQIGLGYIAGNGNIPKGLSACRNAVLLARHIHNSDLLINALIIQTLGLVQSGDLSGARAMLEKTQTATTLYPEYRALKNITNADLALKRGNMALAEEFLSKSEAEIEKFGLIFLYPGTVEVRALFHVQTGQFEQAIQAADHLSDFSILDGNDFYLGISHRIKAVASLCRDRYGEAVDWARKAIQELNQSRRGNIHLSLARQILGISLYHKGDHDQAREELETVLAYFKSICADLGESETALCLGMLLHDSGDPCRGTAYLKAGLEKAMENNYRYFPLVNYRILARGLVMVTAEQVVPGRKLADFLTNFNAPDLLKQVAGEIDKILGKLSKRERFLTAEKLALLFKHTRPKIMIHTLGPFSVQSDNQVLPASVFGGPKPIRLLKLIVLKGGIDIPKEVLIDSLWPDAPVAAGEKNLKVNLHRLRKALEPSPSKDFGNVYLNNREGCISLDPDLVQIDTQLFTALSERGDTHEDEGSFTEALDAYEKAMGLYRGDYFAGELYLDGVENGREFFRSKSMRILEKKAAVHEELDQWQAAVNTWQAVLRMDPCHETAYQNLMILHADAGMKSGAVHVFERCRTVLKAELDTSPGPDTLAIYRRVAAI